MTEHKENELLRDILLDAAAEEVAEEFAGTAHVETSPKFQKSMHSLLANPNGWAKRRQRPLWKRVARTAAVLLLACILSLGVLMMVSPKVYATVANWIAVRYENAMSYHFGGKPKETQTRRYEITYFPDGYETSGQFLIQPDKFSNATAITYSGPNHHELYFEYFPMESSTAKMCYTEDMAVTDIVVNGQPGQLYISQDESESSAVVWMNERDNMCFMIDAFLDGDELLHIAESVVEILS